MVITFEHSETAKETLDTLLNRLIAEMAKIEAREKQQKGGEVRDERNSNI